MDDEQTDMTQAVGNPRAHLLAALLEVFPPTPLVPYGSETGLYDKLYGQDPATHAQSMFIARNSTVMHRWRRLVDNRFKERGQSVLRWQTLFELAANKPTETLTSIANRIGIVGPRLVSLFHELEADGLIERRSDAADRRSKIIVLTSEGEKVIDQLADLLITFKGEILQGIEESEIRLMLDIVNRMSANLDQMTGNEPA